MRLAGGVAQEMASPTLGPQGRPRFRARDQIRWRMATTTTCDAVGSADDGKMRLELGHGRRRQAERRSPVSGRPSPPSTSPTTASGSSPPRTRVSSCYTRACATPRRRNSPTGFRARGSASRRRDTQAQTRRRGARAARAAHAGKVHVGHRTGQAGTMDRRELSELLHPVQLSTRQGGDGAGRAVDGVHDIPWWIRFANRGIDVRAREVHGQRHASRHRDQKG